MKMSLSRRFRGFKENLRRKESIKLELKRICKESSMLKGKRKKKLWKRTSISGKNLSKFNLKLTSNNRSN